MNKIIETLGPLIKFRTSNASEQRAAEHLQSEGWMVFRRGWPDFVAYKNGDVRLIEIKDSAGKLKLSQIVVAAILAQITDHQVEVWAAGDFNRSRNWTSDVSPQRRRKKNVRRLLEKLRKELK